MGVRWVLKGARENVLRGPSLIFNDMLPLKLSSQIGQEKT